MVLDSSISPSSTVPRLENGDRLTLNEFEVNDSQLDWFQLREGEYIPIIPNADGILCSEIFPGLWLDRNALLAGDMAQVLRILQSGLGSEEYQNFLLKLTAD